eukprot:Protomagalhaensia_sp_Gyna_25__3166@NODE_2896_length_829_cov_1599_191139_g2419_i0_p1_GENE_NODE_2896_length_829_cov_1599_191139_g2419_i0NODE_2896_length_829_cov_1599_191139_g2419_i0_p1_ORF_typecomplete_len241_score46_35Linocin_M18/PF04454_12/0_15_NODE_2896_length_829_cov_1599_191139_g2419_i050772
MVLAATYQKASTCTQPVLASGLLALSSFLSLDSSCSDSDYSTEPVFPIPQAAKPSVPNTEDKTTQTPAPVADEPNDVLKSLEEVLGFKTPEPTSHATQYELRGVLKFTPKVKEPTPVQPEPQPVQPQPVQQPIQPQYYVPVVLMEPAVINGNNRISTTNVATTPTREALRLATDVPEKTVKIVNKGTPQVSSEGIQTNWECVIKPVSQSRSTSTKASDSTSSTDEISKILLAIAQNIKNA